MRSAAHWSPPAPIRPAHRHRTHWQRSIRDCWRHSTAACPAKPPDWRVPPRSATPAAAPRFAPEPMPRCEYTRARSPGWPALRNEPSGTDGRGKRSRSLHLGVGGAQDASMIRRLPRLFMLLLAINAGSALAQDDDITIYRCTDAKGQLTLQDAPCGKDKSQQTRRMLQPQDPPPGAAPATRASAPRPAIPEAQPIVVLRTPQPMYECVRADGGRYTSDDDAGNPRWVSSDWT